MLTKSDANFLKGIAILFIMFHNLFHLMPNAPGENEFSFSGAYAVNLFQNLFAHPSDFLKQIFSFFGHYGVQVFVFLSAYGLSQKYNGLNIKYSAFIKQRFSKLYPVFLGIVLLYIASKLVLSIFVPLSHSEFQLMFTSALLRLSLLSNLLPDQALIITGPWWFFSLIFQLYFVFPKLVTFSNKHLVSVVIASWSIQIFSLYFLPSHTEYLRYNFIGHLPEFCLGIYFVKNKISEIRTSYFIGALALFIAGMFIKLLWVFSFFSIPVIFIYLFQRRNKSESIFYRFLVFAGANSLYLFAVHGLLRQPLLHLGMNDGLIALVPLGLFLILAFGISLVFKIGLQQVNDFVCSRG